MAGEELVTIDFMGIHSPKNAKEKCVHDLSWIKPQMVHQVLSLRGLCEEMNGNKDMECSTQKRNVALPSNSIPFGRSAGKQASTKQLTIFYNGTVGVYDVSAEKAKSIFMLASGESCNQRSRSTSPLMSRAISSSAKNENENRADEKPPNFIHPVPPVIEEGQLQKLRTDLPLARKQSLQRFLQKRKDRMTMAAPYSQEDIMSFPPKEELSKNKQRLA
uniref:Tify domain-containing protein n=1 Tax=Araucaria cunninghamii TaxID=56994 RepID=A0A0D6R820_ARACU